MAPPDNQLLRVLSVGDHNTLKFRDMRNFDTESFSGDLIACGILNDSQMMMMMVMILMMVVMMMVMMMMMMMVVVVVVVVVSVMMMTMMMMLIYVWVRICTHQSHTEQWYGKVVFHNVFHLVVSSPNMY